MRTRARRVGAQVAIVDQHPGVRVSVHYPRVASPAPSTGAREAIPRREPTRTAAPVPRPASEILHRRQTGP
jgi:hypothetical protein